MRYRIYSETDTGLRVATVVTFATAAEAERYCIRNGFYLTYSLEMSPIRRTVLRFTNVWRMRWHRHGAAFTGGVATVTSFALVAAMASIIGSGL